MRSRLGRAGLLPLPFGRWPNTTPRRLRKAKRAMLKQHYALFQRLRQQGCT